jgi:hypothetical protein
MTKHMGFKMSGILFATVFALSLFGASLFLFTPGAMQVEAREEAASCRMEPVALDEGYSISRIEMRQVCGFDR